jgi:hypothetical protein
LNQTTPERLVVAQEATTLAARHTHRTLERSSQWEDYLWSPNQPYSLPSEVQ